MNAHQIIVVPTVAVVKIMDAPFVSACPDSKATHHVHSAKFRIIPANPHHVVPTHNAQLPKMVVPSVLASLATLIVPTRFVVAWNRKIHVNPIHVALTQFAIHPETRFAIVQNQRLAIHSEAVMNLLSQLKCAAPDLVDATPIVMYPIIVNNVTASPDLLVTPTMVAMKFQNQPANQIRVDPTPNASSPAMVAACASVQVALVVIRPALLAVMAMSVEWTMSAPIIKPALVSGAEIHVLDRVA
jgi:hypothetical protein